MPDGRSGSERQDVPAVDTGLRKSIATAVSRDYTVVATGASFYHCSL